MAYSALKWIHGLLPIPHNPLVVGLCQKFVDAERRRRKTPILKKQPTSLELMKKIADKFVNESATLKDLRLATMSVISFAGLFRSKKLLNIRVCDVSLKDDHAKIHVASSKTDVYREGQDVYHKVQYKCMSRLVVEEVSSKSQRNFKQQFRLLV